MADTTTGQTISVIGLGAMGTALAKAFLANHHHVTVWNRTASKCTPLAQAGAQIARSVAEAADASQAMVVCVLDYAASNSLLHALDVSARLRGKTVVQLTTGMPQDAREAEAWAKQHGVAYLDGTIQGYPKDIGTPEGTILYAGSRAVFEATQPVLRSLGGHALFVGENIGTASALDAGLVGSYVAGTVLAFLHGAALCEAEGVSLDTYLSIALRHVMPGLVTDTMQMCVEMIKKGSYAGSQATLDTCVAGMGHFVQFSRASGVDSTYPEGVLGYFQRAVAQGHGQDELPAVFECFRKKAGRAKTE
ncbi:MAG: NAD(P)-dependent oxidoreductase [Deltaproteobacteria bacterium]|nr:NAD(P)-dependent oxidoreductase [Deltaproteobacteria bacterium]